MAQSTAVSATTLQDHIAYHSWATARLLDAAAKLSPEEMQRDFQTATHSVLGTLVHIFAADRVWLGRIQGNPPSQFVTDADHDFLLLLQEWPLLHERWRAWAAGLTDETAQASFSYRDLKGNSWSQTIWQIVFHLVNHGTHHRGQVSGFLRSLGQTPPPLDLIAYYRQQPKL
jgi:uncharacterized damage-inducible protein DinB